MIKSYEPPRTKVEQNLETTTPQETAARHATIVGGRYELHRHAEERDEKSGVVFAQNSDADPNARQTVPWEQLGDSSIVDLATAELFGESLEGRVAKLDSPLPTDQAAQNPYLIDLLSLNEPNKIHVNRRGARIMAIYDALSGHIVDATVVFKGSGYDPDVCYAFDVIGGSGTGARVKLVIAQDGTVSSVTVCSPGSGYDSNILFDAPAGSGANLQGDNLISELFGRDLKVGDVVYVTDQYGAVTARRSVSALLREDTAAKFGSAKLSDDKAFAAGASNPATRATAVIQNQAAPPNWSTRLSANSLLAVSLTEAGVGYTEAPTVTVDPPPTIAGALAHTSETALASATIENGAVKAISVDFEGAGYVDGGVTSVTITDGGTGVSDIARIEVTAPNLADGRKAVIEPVVVGGIITNYKIVDTGSGYTSPPTLTVVGGSPTVTPILAAVVSDKPDITLAGGGGGVTTPATATSKVFSRSADWDGRKEGAHYNGAYGERYLLTVLEGGIEDNEARVKIATASGSFSADSVAVARVGDAFVVNDAALGGLVIELKNSSATVPLKVGDVFSFVVFGEYLTLALGAGVGIDRLNLIAGGAGYQDGEIYTEVVIAPPCCGGVQAQATATVVAGAVTGFTLTNPGSGYKVPPSVTIVSHDLNGTIGESSEVTGFEGSKAFDKDLSTYWQPDTIPTAGAPEHVEFTLSADDEATRYRVTCTSNVRLKKFKLQGDAGGGFVDLDTYDGVALAVVDRSLSLGTGYTTYRLLVEEAVGADHETPVAPQIIEFELLNATGTMITQGHGAIVTADLQLVGDVHDLVLTDDSVFTSETSTQYKLRVVSVPDITDANNPFDGSVIEISDSAGIDPTVQVTITHGTIFDVGRYGLRAVFPLLTDPGRVHGYGLTVGDVYTIDATAGTAAGAYSIVQLNGNAANTEDWVEADRLSRFFDLDIRALVSGQIALKSHEAPHNAFEATTDGIRVRHNLHVQVDGRWLPVIASSFGKLFSSFRALQPATAGQELVFVTSEEEILAEAGVADPENDLGFAALSAFRAGSGKGIWVGRVATNDLAGFKAIMKSAEHLPSAYAWAITSTDADIQNALADHVDAASQAKRAMWRIAYLGSDVDGAYAKLTKASDGETLQATILPVGDSGNVRVVAPNAQFVASGIRAGDLLRVNFQTDEWNESVSDEYVIASVTEEEELLLETGPAAAVDPAARIEVWRADTGLSQAELAAAVSESHDARRIRHVWCDSPRYTNADGESLVVSNVHTAAELAGLRAAAQPHQGLTRAVISQAAKTAPLTYSKYDESDLDYAAARGTLVLFQPHVGADLQVRHQLTTEVDKGSLYYEDSVTSNVDDISRRAYNIGENYRGIRNVTRETIEEFESELSTELNRLATAENNNRLGPQILRVRDIEVWVDENRTDTINYKVTVELPLPVNNIIITIDGTTASAETLGL